jgi:hypothetical protein
MWQESEVALEGALANERLRSDRSIAELAEGIVALQAQARLTPSNVSNFYFFYGLYPCPPLHSKSTTFCCAFEALHILDRPKWAVLFGQYQRLDCPPRCSRLHDHRAAHSNIFRVTPSREGKSWTSVKWVQYMKKLVKHGAPHNFFFIIIGRSQAP